MPSPEAEVFRRFTRSVLEAQSALLRHGDTANGPLGQSSARWRVLLDTSLGGRSVADIARATDSSRQAVQRLADALVDEGSARYVADETDRRVQRIELTRAGRRTLRKLEANFDEWAGRLMGRLSDANLLATTRALEHVSEVVLSDVRNLRNNQL